MTIWSNRVAATGALVIASMALAGSAAAKCAPATDRLLPRPNGKQFISVFITCDSQPDALRAFADTSTKHPQLLGSVKMNVEQVNLGAKGGVYYRTLVGEPGSKASAAATCTALKAAGYRWCRAMPY
jgi:predicted nucleic acid-binding Zn ribbon protein